jgi:hypothetical protein
MLRCMVRKGSVPEKGQKKGQSRNNVITRLLALLRYRITDEPYGGGHDMAHLTFSSAPPKGGTANRVRM